MEYQKDAYFVTIYFLTLLFCQLSIYSFPSSHPHNGKFARRKLRKCYSAYCTLLCGEFNIDKLSNSQLHLAKFTSSHCQIATFTSQTWQIYIILWAAQNFLTALNIHWVPNFFKTFFCPNFVFLGCFVLGWVGLALVAYPPTS